MSLMKEAMTEGQHYGRIPGCGENPTLLQPGAQVMACTFRLAPSYAVIIETPKGEHRAYQVTCTLRHHGEIIADGVGYCSSMESKYRFRNGARKCPECGKEAIIKGKTDYGGGWICFTKKGGCGAKWKDGDKAIEAQETGQAENPNPADVFNTVLKMAKKRAYVDAVISATACNDLFTQDLEDIRDNLSAVEIHSEVVSNEREQPPIPPQCGGRAPDSKPETSIMRGLTVALVSLVSKPDAKAAWQVTFGDGAKAGTFDAETARRCDQYIKNERKVDVSLRPTSKAGSFEIVSVEDSI